MVSDCKDNVGNIINQSDDDVKSLINSLCEDKLKLLKEKRFLLNTIAEKDEQLIKVSENFQKKWESVCLYLKSVSELCHDLQLNPSLANEFKSENRLIFECPMDSSISNSSFFMTTTDETGDSNFTTSTESLIAATGSLQNTLEPHEKYYSLNSLPTEQARYVAPYSSAASHSDLGECVVDSGKAPGLEESVATGGGGGEGCTSRQQQHLHNSSKSPVINPGTDSALPEPHFRVPDMSIQKAKKLVKRSSTIKSDRPTNKPERSQNSNSEKRFSEYSTKELYNWLVNVVRLPRLFLDELHAKNKLEGVCLDQISETKLSKLIGTSDKLIRKKIFLALEDAKSGCITRDTATGTSDLASKDHLWVANIWLKRHLGLSHLSHAFLSRCIDGNLLKFIATSPHTRQKELLQLAANSYDHCSGGLPNSPGNSAVAAANRSISEPSKTDIRSIKYGLELLAKFDFQLNELDRRRSSCESSNLDVLVWTNERVAKWFSKMNLKNYIRGIEYSGIHGGMMVLDQQFSMATMSKLLQIPIEVVKKNNLDDKFSSLLKPSRFNEGVKTRRSTSIFRRRSYSQPRHSNASATSRKENVPTHYKSSAPNTDQSDSASINNGIVPAHTANLANSAKSNHREKSQTLDLSNSTNQNFVRKYRKPMNRALNNTNYPNPQPTLSEPMLDIHPPNTAPSQQKPRQADNANLLVPGNLFTKSPKPITQSAQIARKLKSQSSGSDEEDSDNSEEL